MAQVPWCCHLVERAGQDWGSVPLVVDVGALNWAGPHCSEGKEFILMSILIAFISSNRLLQRACLERASKRASE